MFEIDIASGRRAPWCARVRAWRLLAEATHSSSHSSLGSKAYRTSERDRQY
jgi:hypothetical protein